MQQSASTAPTERSMPPISKVNVMPTVTMINAALSMKRLRNTWGRIKPLYVMMPAA